MDEPPRKQQKRCGWACDNCKRKKDRCDGQQSCGLCRKRNHACHYSTNPARHLVLAVDGIREWVNRLPHLPAALERQTTSPDHIDLARTIASAHLMGACYWSVNLVTRPFLLFHVSMRQPEGSAVKAIAEACIIAAINGIDLVEDVLSNDRLPRKSPSL